MNYSSGKVLTMTYKPELVLIKKNKKILLLICIVMKSPAQFINQSRQCFNYRCVRVTFPYGARRCCEIKERHVNLWCVNANVCPESFACQQTRRLGGGKWGVTRGPTHARLWQLLLWWSCELMGLQVKRNAASQTLTVNILLLSPPRE